MKEPIENKIFDLAGLKSQVAKWRSAGEKTVFTNGCFDLLHLGHIMYLHAAAGCGDKLIVGVNTDFSVKRIKGSSRPINDQKMRCYILASLFYVDAVVLFDEDTPLELIEEICPQVLVKGADYEVQNIVGSREVLENNGEVFVIDLLPGYSSSAILNQINSQNK